MSMTNTVALVSVVVTNWLGIGSDRMTEGGTNYVRQVCLVQTNLYVEEVTLCTNRTLYRAGQMETNSVPLWRALSPQTPPPLPSPQFLFQGSR